MPRYPDCPTCGEKLIAASLPEGIGGRVGWFCMDCEDLFPDGSYVTMRSIIPDE